MDYLIDTHVALWWWANDSQLSKAAKILLQDSENTIFFSSVSAYEILLKHRLGKLLIPQPLINDILAEVKTEGWSQRSLTVEAASMAAQFEQDHRDPFDRMLAAQSITSKMPLISVDAELDPFGVKRVW